MPFTLAHPAAVLPLKRFCPRYLSFSALVIGSIAPDVGYCFGPLKLDEFSHRFIGSFGFCLPVGAVMLAMLYGLRGTVVERLPEQPRKAFEPLCRKPIASPFVLIISLLVGCWTHQAWDAFTHSHSWLVMQVPFLHAPIGVMFHQTVIVSHVLWYISSFGGVAVLCFAYERWRVSSQGAMTAQSRAAALRHAVVVGLLVMPIELAHHRISNVSGLALLGVCSIALVVFVALKIGNTIPRQSSE